MKNYVKMFLAGIFLATAFPFTMVLLLNGRQGIHKEKQLDPVDYQVLQQMLAEDLSWMSDDTLKLLAVLYRTEAFCVGESSAIEQLSLSELYGEPYGRIYQAIESTSGMAVLDIQEMGSFLETAMTMCSLWSAGKIKKPLIMCRSAP